MRTIIPKIGMCISNCYDYLFECTHLLYWAYLKPYSLARMLYDIHPNLISTDNPFLLERESSSNARLRRYASQFWLICAVAPLAILLPAGFVHAQTSGDSSPRGALITFLALWEVILFLGTFYWRGIVLIYCTSIVVFLILIFVLNGTPAGSQIMPVVGLPIIFLVIALAFGLRIFIMFTIACSLGLAAYLGLINAIIVSVVVGLGVALVFTSIGSTYHEDVSSRVAAIMCSIPLAAATAHAIGWVILIVFVCALIVGFPRLYLWLPEAIWMCILVVRSRKGNGARRLRYLPLYFDQQTVLPLPFLKTLLVEAFWENPAIARRTIFYVLTLTNKTKLGVQILSTINSVLTTKESKTTRHIGELQTLKKDWDEYNTTREDMLRRGHQARIRQAIRFNLPPAFVISMTIITAVMAFMNQVKPLPISPTSPSLVGGIVEEVLPQNPRIDYVQATSGSSALHDLLNKQSRYQWDENTSCTFMGGNYHVIVAPGGVEASCFAKTPRFTSFLFQVQMTINKGYAGGILFRSGTRTYQFTVDTTGNYGFYGGAYPIERFGTTSGNQPIFVSVEAIDNNFYIYVNKLLVLSSRSDSFVDPPGAGIIGVYATAFGEFQNTPVSQANADVSFSNAQVWTL